MPIKKCVCSNSFQDGRYGHKNRVANPTDKAGVFRCTACGKDIMPAKTTKVKKVTNVDQKGKK